MLGNGLHVPLRADAFEQVLESVRLHPQPDAEDVFHVDWSGIRTRIPMLTWAPQELAGTTSTALPIPTDGYRSEAEEYLSLILSLESERSDYLAIEVGAGWAPWAVAGIVFAKRMGKRARGIAVEADPVRAGWAMQLEVLMPGTELIEQRVRFLAVGTHNRYVEGMLMHHLLPREWALLLESPSTAIFDGVRPSLTGFTVQDGNQLWANPRFRDAADVILR
mgnify:CR=1 FL=1